jgi:hypothetical protein
MDSSYSSGFKAGQINERDRILELLKDECDCDHDYLCQAHKFAALISQGVKKL